jgi:outer membrane protein OmpA-like peptidoglycan-associated protein
MKAETARAITALPVWSGTKQRNWLLVGLIGSLALHALLCLFFYRTRFQPAEVLDLDKQPSPSFKVKSVDLEPPPLEKATADQTNPAGKPNPDKTDVQLPQEQKSFDKLLEEVHASAAMPDDTRDVLPDKPKVEPTNPNTLINDIERTTAQMLATSPNAAREQSLLTNAGESGRPQPAMNGTEIAASTTIKRPNNFNGIPGDSAGPRTNRVPGLSGLVSLLSQKGPLVSGTKLLMPDNQLFAYDSAELRPSELLAKLGTLIRRNPRATFTIEGYTDAYGSDYYNLDLSQRRAESVKQYLVQVIGINSGQIETRGYGKAKLLTSPYASIEEQQINRRVVIVVNTNER